MTFTAADLKKLVSEGETPGVEYKSSVQKEAGKSISAFVNTYGGTIIFGVEPKNRNLKGLENPDEQSQRLRNILDNCKPNPKPEQEFVKHDGKTFIILKLEPFAYSQNPCFYTNSCYLRQGTTNLELSGEELIDFLKRRTLLNFEESKSNLAFENLDLEKVKVLLNKRGVSTADFTGEDLKRIMVGLKIANYNGSFFLKNVAVLFFAKMPEFFLSNLEVRIVKYDGIEQELESISLDTRIQGTIPDLIEKTFEVVSDNIPKTYVLVGTKREQVLSYPSGSLREVITNAFGHRDYFDSNEVLVEIFEDRLQITNPGGLLPGQNINNFDKTPRHRNPISYRLLHDLGLGEGLGLGVKLIRKQFRKAKLPDPEFYDVGNAFQVVFYNARSRKKRYSVDFENMRQKQAIAYLQNKPYIKTAEYAKMTSVSQPTAIKDLTELVKQGKIRKIGRYRGAYYELVKNNK